MQCAQEVACMMAIFTSNLVLRSQRPGNGVKLMAACSVMLEWLLFNPPVGKFFVNVTEILFCFEKKKSFEKLCFKIELFYGIFW